MSKILAFLKREFLELLPPTIFFFVVFELVIFTRSLMGSELQPSMTTSATAAVGALIVGKSILVADALPLFRWFQGKRMILNVVWRVFLYLVFVLAFQFLEELIPLVKKYEGLAAAASHLIGEIQWPRFLATHVLLAVFLSLYSFIMTLISVIGRDRFLEVFFGYKTG